MALKAVLEECSCSVQVASSGSEALEVIRNHRFDVVLLDYNMPCMDGVTLHGHIKRIQPNLEAILMTGSVASEPVDRAIAVGIGQLLRKPVKLRDLLESIQRAAKQTSVNAMHSHGSDLETSE